jgi:hypothetical protein
MGTLFYVGLALALIGQLWLVVLAILNGKTIAEKIIWAIVNMILQPITGIIFLSIKRTGLVPLILVIVGQAIILFVYYSAMRGMIGTIPS